MSFVMIPGMKLPNHSDSSLYIQFAACRQGPPGLKRLERPPVHSVKKRIRKKNETEKRYWKNRMTLL